MKNTLQFIVHIMTLVFARGALFYLFFVFTYNSNLETAGNISLVIFGCGVVSSVIFTSIASLIRKLFFDNLSLDFASQALIIFSTVLVSLPLAIIISRQVNNAEIIYGIFLLILLQGFYQYSQVINLAKQRAYSIAIGNSLFSVTLLIGTLLLDSYSVADYVKLVSFGYLNYMIGLILSHLLFKFSHHQKTEKKSLWNLSKKEYNFLWNYFIYSLVGMPIIYLVQSLIELSAGKESLGKVAIIIQITNLVNFINQNLLNFRFKNLVSFVNSSDPLKEMSKVSRLYIQLNILVSIVAILLVFVFKDYIIGDIRLDFSVLALGILAVAFTSILWLYNEISIAIGFSDLAFKSNVVFGAMLVAFTGLFFIVLNFDQPVYYVAAVFISRSIASIFARAKLTVRVR